jgi:methylenetetrahydrofolate dehydrogenase (NADP+)/methenyltetrahydrofolate cyclohydrolase
MTILDGNKTSEQIKLEIADEVKTIENRGGKIPHLAAVLVGDDGASQTYVNSKVKDCQQVGFGSTLVRLEANTSEQELLDTVQAINDDQDIDGIIVQLPLPDHISVVKVTERIKPEKDVDGFHPVNVGRMVKGLPAYIAATPFGIMQLLERYKVETSGMNCVIIGRSDIVGTPMSLLMARKANPGNCTVTLCHSRTRDIKAHTLEADIVIAALGRPGFLTGDMVKKGVTVIDVGITRVADATRKRGYTLKGDVDFETVSPKSSFITPVPGGVGPMTRAALLWNTLQSAKKTFYQTEPTIDY